MACLVYLQTQGGEPAKGYTKNEFEHFLSELQGEVTKWCNSNRGLGLSAGNFILSYDNAPFHNSELPERLLFNGLIDLPAYSPDLHQVIEHAIGNLKAKFSDRLDDIPNKYLGKKRRRLS